MNMEEGSLRCDANVSIRPAGATEFGTKTELKNMNSFRFLTRGIEAEIARQDQLLRDGEHVVQETLHFDPDSGRLSPLRSKEEAHDYRYFPEPDLVPLAPTEDMLERARAALPELPGRRAAALSSRSSGCRPSSPACSPFRASSGTTSRRSLAADGTTEPRVAANWVSGELVARIGDLDPATSNVTPASLARLVGLVSERAISQSAAKEVLSVLASEGGDPDAIVAERGLARAGAEELEGIVDRAIDANQRAVEELRAGKQKAIGAIVGAVMRETKGRADGGEVQRLIRERIG